MILNLLRTSRQHPQLFAAAHYHGIIDYNKTAFYPPGCKIIAHEKPSQWQTWAPHGRYGYSLGPAMHHYRYQNVYITSTASKRIVDMWEFFPHNSPMPQISSMDRLLMAANDMTNALKHPHPYAPFATVGYDTITVLSQLATLFKNKFQKPLAPELVQAPAKVDENKKPSALVQPILTSPMKHNYQTRSQHAIPRHSTNLSKSHNSPLLPRVVTPVARNAAPLRVPARTHNLSPSIFFPGRLLGYGKCKSANCIGYQSVDQPSNGKCCCTPLHGQGNGIHGTHEGPSHQALLEKRFFGNEVGRLFQGIRDIQGTNTRFLIEINNIPKDIHITLGKSVCDYKPHKKEK
jgi:hypothetical protein